MKSNDNQILNATEFWGEVDMHINTTADVLIKDLAAKKIEGETIHNAKNVCMN